MRNWANKVIFILWIILLVLVFDENLFFAIENIPKIKGKMKAAVNKIIEWRFRF